MESSSLSYFLIVRHSLPSLYSHFILGEFLRTLRYVNCWLSEIGWFTKRGNSSFFLSVTRLRALRLHFFRFKREFAFTEVMNLWEVLWTGLPCQNFHLVRSFIWVFFWWRCSLQRIWFLGSSLEQLIAFKGSWRAAHSFALLTCVVLAVR